MTSHPALKVSYCTTCKGRLHHLKQTLPRNLAAEKDNPNVEFIIVDYGSEDGLGEWIQKNYADEIVQGRIKYIRHEASYFQMAHAKNIAHRMASPDSNILCSLDADNVIAKNYSQWLIQALDHNPNAIIAPNLLTRLVKEKVGLKGISGRIAMSHDNFYRLGGYNEQFKGWGGDDMDLLRRARIAGLHHVGIPLKFLGSVLEHSDADRVANVHPDTKGESLKHATRTKLEKIRKVIERRFEHSDSLANLDGSIGCGSVMVNFKEARMIESQAAPATAVCSQVQEMNLRTDWLQTIEQKAGTASLAQKSMTH